MRPSRPQTLQQGIEPLALRSVMAWVTPRPGVAHDVRRLALEHPNAFPLIATRHPSAPWLRHPLRSLRVVEAYLNGLRERGFTDRQAVQAYRSLGSFLLGHLLLECAVSGAETSFAEEPLDEGDADLPTTTASSTWPTTPPWPSCRVSSPRTTPKPSSKKPSSICRRAWTLR